MKINDPTSSSLKRSFAETASTPHQSSDSPSVSSQPPTSKSQRTQRSISPHQGNQPMSSPRSHPGHDSPRTRSPSGRGAFRSNSFRGHRDHNSRNNSRSHLSDREKDWDTLELPLRDENLIKQTYQGVNVSTPTTDNPKNFLTNFVNQTFGTPLDFKYKDGMINKQRLWRFIRFPFRLT